MVIASSDDWATDAEARFLNAAVRLAPALGWNERLVHEAEAEIGLSRAEGELLWPKGATDLAALLIRRHDEQTLAALAKIDVRQLKIRERIHAAVEARIDAGMADEAATRACHRFMAAPSRLPLSLRLGWETADKLWRWAGDTATDENHYSKRAILATILATTLVARMVGGPEQARKHLSGRIDQVMAFEKWKATGAPKPSEWGKAAAGWLGGLRYGPRRSDQPRA